MEQINMFPELKNDVEKEWIDMPEFVMKDLEPVKQLIVSFRNFEDYKDFAKLINQNLTPKTQSCWYPKVKIGTYADKIYQDKARIETSVDYKKIEVVDAKIVKPLEPKKAIEKNKAPLILFWSIFDKGKYNNAEEWINDEAKISSMHLLTLQSFLKYNENVFLYTYQKSISDYIPKGITVLNSHSVMDYKQAYASLSNGHSIAHISDLIRLDRALYKNGIVLDMDNVCLRPFENVTGFTSSHYAKLTGGMAQKFKENNPALTVNDKSWDGKALSMFPLKICEPMRDNINQICLKIRRSLSNTPLTNSKAWNYVMWDLKLLPKLEESIRTYPPKLVCPVPGWKSKGNCYSLTDFDSYDQLFGNKMESIDYILKNSYTVAHFFESAFKDCEITKKGFWNSVPENSLLGREAEHILGAEWKKQLIEKEQKL